MSGMPAGRRGREVAADDDEEDEFGGRVLFRGSVAVDVTGATVAVRSESLAASRAVCVRRLERRPRSQT